MNSKVILVIPLMLFLLIPSTAFAQTDFSATSSATTSGSEPIIEEPFSDMVTFEVPPVRIEEPYPPETGVFKDFDNILNEDGSYTMTTHIPYFETIEGEFIPYQLIENDSIVQVTIDGGKFVWDKTNGALTIFNDQGIVIDSDSYVVRTATLDTDVWNNLAVNDETVVTTVVENVDDMITVSFIKENDEGLFTVEYILVGDNLKTTAYFTNYSYDNNKFAFTETINLPDSVISLNGMEDIDLINYVGQSFPREVLEQNEDLILQIKDMYYSSGIGFDNLWSVNISSPTKVSLDYANVDEIQTAIGETIELDPTFSGTMVWLDSATIFATGLGNGTTTCSGTASANAPSLVQHSGQDVKFQSGSSYLSNVGDYWNNCSMSIVKPNISLPSGATTSDFKIHSNSNLMTPSTSISITPVTTSVTDVSAYIAQHNTSYSPTTTLPSGSSVAPVFTAITNNIINNTAYISGGSFSQNTWYSLGTQANSDRDLYGSDFLFAVTMNTNNLSASEGFIAHRQGGANYANPTVSFEVTYSVQVSPSTPSAPTVSANTPINGQITVNWTAPNDGGSALTDYKIYVSGSGVSNYNFNTGNTATTWVHTNPVLGIPYQYQVVAYNSIGSSNPSSGSAFATAAWTPDTPLAPVVSINPDNTIDMSWTAVNFNGIGTGGAGATAGGYEIYQNGVKACYWGTGANNGYLIGCTQSPYLSPLFQGTSNNQGFPFDGTGSIGTPITFTIKAQNTSGYISAMSPASNSVTPSAVPDVPSPPVVVWNASTNTNNITWTAPNDNGSALQGYQLLMNGVNQGLRGTSPLYWNHSDSTLTAQYGNSVSYTIQTWNAKGNSGYSSASNSVIPSIIPAVPSAPTATTETVNGTNTITWSAPNTNGSAITDYRLYANGNLLNTLNANTFTHSPALGVATTYQVSATNINGYSSLSSNSNSVTASTAPDTPVAPVATFTSNTSNTIAITAPSNNSSNIDDYRLYENGTLVGSIGVPTGLSHVVTGITITSTNNYQVSAHNANGWSGISPVSNSVLSANAPASPTLTGASGTPVILNWTTPQSDMTITNYKIYRDGTLHDTVGVVSTYSDSTNLVSGTTYGYTVSAVGTTIGEGSQSSSISLIAGLPPDAPTGLSTSINNPNTTPLDITVNWSAPAYTGTSTISNYEVYRDGTLVATVGNVLTHTDTVPTGGGTFVYSLKAVTAHGTSILSATTSQTTATVPPTPTVSPTLTIVSPDATPLDITASWVAQSTGGSALTGYEVFRSTDNVTFTSVGTTTTLSLTDTVPSAGLYYYKFSSINLIGNSSQSTSSNTATPTVPDASSVTAFIANPNPSPFDATVSFVAPSSNGGSAVTGYNLYLSPDDITYTQVATNVTSTQIITVSGVGTHYFKSEAINLIGTGVLGSAVSIATPNTPDAPSLTLAIPDPNSFPFDTTATFVAPTNNGGSLVTGYNLYYSSDDITYTSIATATSGTISHTVGSAGTHYFKAESISNAGTGVLSSAFTIATPTVPDASSVTLAIDNPNPSPFIITSSLVAPSFDGGSTVNSYNLHYSSDDITYTQIATAINGTFDYTVSGVGTHYFKSQATNLVGTGALGSAVSIATPNAPNAPSITLTIPNPDTTPLVIVSSFVTPANNGGSNVTGYNLYHSTDNITFTQIATNQTTDQTTTVANAGTYYFKAEAISNAGTGVLSSAFTIATPTVPNAPSITLTIPDPHASPFSINSSFTVPANDGGSNVTGYNLYTSDDNITFTQIATNVTADQTTVVATAGTYYFKAEAINLIGTGVLSSAFTIATPTVPSTPLNATSNILALDVTPYNVTVTWNTPTSNGGSNLTGYDVYRKQGNASPIFITNTTALTIVDTVPSLLNTNFTYEIYAVNNVGQSSTFIDTVITTRNVPTAPALTYGVTGTTSFTWTAPASDATVTSYNIFRDSVLLTNVSSATLSHTDWTLITFGQSYTYKVQAVSILGNGTFSNNIVILPETEITGMIAQGITGTGAVIDWDAPAYYQGNLTYNVWYVTPAITTGTPTVSAGTTLNTYSNFAPQLDYDTSYTFGVTITSPLGNSGFSNLVTLTTNVDGSIVSADPTTGGMAWFDIDSVNEDSLNVIEFQRETQVISGVPTDTLQVAYPSWWDDMTCNVDYKFAQKTEQYVEGTDMTSVVNANNADQQVIGFQFQDVDNEVIEVQCAPQQSSEGDEGSGVFVITQNNLSTGLPDIPMVTQITNFSNGSYGTDGDFGALNIVGLFAILISMVGFNRVNPIVGVFLSASLIFALSYFGIISIPIALITVLALVIFLAWGISRRR